LGCKKDKPTKNCKSFGEISKIILKGKATHIPLAGVISASKSKEIIKTLGNYISVKERRSKFR